jgi:hypothetical protein
MVEGSNGDDQMASSEIKIEIVKDSFGYEVHVSQDGTLLSGERHGSMADAVCAAKFLSVKYGAPIENRTTL